MGGVGLVEGGISSLKVALINFKDFLTQQQ